MSYDLYFIPPESSADPASFFERMEERPRPDTPECDSRKQAVVEALRQLDRALEPFPFDHVEIAKALGTTVEEARQAYGHVELNGPGNGDGIQVTVHGDHVSVTVAYWHAGSEASRVFSIVEQYAVEIATAGNYRIYDPQLERVVGRFDEIRIEVLRKYAGVVDRIPQIIAASAKKPRPWWKLW